MSQFGSGGGGGGSAVLGGGCGGTEFHLPDEILSVIPTDPYEQLDLARKITSLAIASRVSTLETDVDRMRQRLYEKEKAVCDLQEKVSHLQCSYQEVDSRLKTTLDDNLKLSKERDSLAMTVKKLNRDLSKLEAFKRQLMQSLSDDNSSAETVDIGTCDQTVPQAYPEKGLGTDGHTIHHSLTGFTDKIDEVSKLGGQRFSFTPYITPRLTPTGTPKFTSTSVSPRSYSVAATPQRTSAFTSPTKSHHDRQDSISSWFPTSQQSSAANSPPRGRPIPGHAPRIDGKEFFRQARSRLSYEQFSAFLANIKELNAQKQTREETLRKAEEIFGIENKDLFLSFQGLLNRNMR